MSVVACQTRVNLRSVSASQVVGSPIRQQASLAGGTMQDTLEGLEGHSVPDDVVLPS